MTRLEAVRAELGALLTGSLAMSFGRGLAADALEPSPSDAPPVVLVHGLFGSAANFHALRRHLEGRGLSRFASFRYAPRIDYQSIAARLGEFVENVCARTGAAVVDVVGHSLGGIVGRWLVEHGPGRRVRRLVTLGAPWYGHRFPSRELALFGAHDWLIAAPATDRVRGQVRVLPDLSHMSLLYGPSALDAVADHLTAVPRPLRLRVVGRERVG